MKMSIISTIDFQTVYTVIP